jgi:hypothetical protein
VTSPLAIIADTVARAHYLYVTCRTSSGYRCRKPARARDHERMSSSKAAAVMADSTVTRRL